MVHFGSETFDRRKGEVGKSGTDLLVGIGTEVDFHLKFVCLDRDPSI